MKWNFATVPQRMWVIFFILFFWQSFEERTSWINNIKCSSKCILLIYITDSDTCIPYRYYIQRWQINTCGVMFPLIQSWTLSTPNQAGLLGQWILSTAVTQWGLTMCAASHSVSVCDPLTMKPIHYCHTTSPHTSPSLFVGPAQSLCQTSSSPPPKTTTATQLPFGLSPGQVLSTTTSQATQLVDCFCLLTLLPSLPGSPGTPANPCGKRTSIIVNWVLDACGITGRDYGLLLVKTDADRCLCHVFSRPVDN